MGGTPVIFIGYELEEDALDIYSVADNPRGEIKSLLRIVEAKIGILVGVVRYDDLEEQTHQFVCCFVVLSGRTYSSKELGDIVVHPEFFHMPSMVKTKGEFEHKFSPSAFVDSYGADGKTRVLPGAVIG
ncbi:unnamed protein product [Cyclocybe aegerita]|uniref:Uncharacterized protein n=1 Tax=Cyclocybe aegerita TaxID=1973307 RepID=A0A8S0XQS3_CYCAE|nr:unnamed protein product [Cyclocybe aegerita]